MRRVLILADTPGWCFARRAEALQLYAPSGWQITVDFLVGRCLTEIVYEHHDLVFLLAPHKAREMRVAFDIYDIRVPLLVSHNSGVGREGYSINDVLAAADYTIVNNYGAWRAGRFGVRDYRACNISNGVDLKLFRPTVPIAERPYRILWTGSEHKANDKNDVKGYQRILEPLSRLLDAKGIEHDFRIVGPGSAMRDEEMVDFYNSGQVLICTSTSEGTPNICLEAAACGTALITTPVGNMPELVRSGQNGFFLLDASNVIEPLTIIEAMRNHVCKAARAMLGDIQSWDWSVRAKWFYALFEALITRGAGNVAPFTYLRTSPEEIGSTTDRLRFDRKNGISPSNNRRPMPVEA